MLNRYAEQAISIRELAAQVKSAEVRVQLLQIAALYEKLSDLLRDAAVHSLIGMASTLHGDLLLRTAPSAASHLTSNEAGNSLQSDRRDPVARERQ